MPRVEVLNSISKIWASSQLIKEIDDLTSYPVEDAKFVQAFRSGFWDGRMRLLRKSRAGDFYLLPTGLLTDIMPVLNGAEIIDSRRMPRERMAIEWVGKSHREYQLRAIEEALKDRGVVTGRGMLNLPIRSGKTMIAGGIMQRTGLSTLFVVPSDLLLYQTVEALKEMLNPAPVAQLGAGRHDTNWITVATIQTLMARPELARQLLNDVDILIQDECHHIEGEAWRNPVLKSDAMYKLGLSATIFVSNQMENQRSSIWLKACCGPILYRVSMNRLIDQGFLMRPHVRFRRFKHEAPGRRLSPQTVIKIMLVENRRRNNLIADIAESHIKEGRRVLIDTGRIEQMKTLLGYMEARGIATEVVYGKTRPEKRWEVIRRFQSKTTMCLIGTVFGEGVDIPELEVVVNAEGQKSAKAAIQRMRNLTPSEGKGEVIFEDILDMGQKNLANQAMERLKLYQGMRGFTVEVV